MKPHCYSLSPEMWSGTYCAAHALSRARGPVPAHPRCAVVGGWASFTASKQKEKTRWQVWGFSSKERTSSAAGPTTSPMQLCPATFRKPVCDRREVQLRAK